MGKGLYRGQRRHKTERVELPPTPEAIAYFQSLSQMPSPSSDLHRRLILRSSFTAGDPLDQGFIDGEARRAPRT